MSVSFPETRPLVERIEIVAVRTSIEYAAVFELRRQVFKVEKGMAGSAVEDADDRRSLVALAYLVDDSGRRRPAGTGRLTVGAGPAGEGVVTWVATAADARRRGIGDVVMRFLLDAADRAGSAAVILAAQVPAIAFYRRLGFVANGRLYPSSGIQHLPMVRYRPSDRRWDAGRTVRPLDW